MTVPAGRWGRSHEEDHDGVEVYRPAGFHFPPARGRAWIEVRPDGTFVELAPGRADVPEPVEGTWVLGSDAGLESAPADARVADVVHAGSDRLELRRPA